MSTLLQDLRYSLRLLAKTPGFTFTAIAVLALGIGVNTGIFSVVHALVLSPRPFPEPKQVVQLYTQDTKKPQSYRTFSYPLYQEIRRQDAMFAGVLAHNLAMVGLGEGSGSRRTFAGIVSANYFDVLGVRLARGRAFTTEEEQPGSAAAVTIVSYDYWRRNGFAPDIVGSTLRVNERPYTVVGVAPQGFTGTMMLFGPEVYFPLGLYDVLNNDFDAKARRTLEKSDAYNLFLVARLRPGLTVAAAKAALGPLATAVAKAYPAEMKEQTFTAALLPRLSTSNAPNDESGLGLVGLLLLGMTSIVLLIASLNLANMLLARGASRRKEIAIRLALGGGRGRIVRQLLTEGLVLALGGGVLGVLLGGWSSDLLVSSLAVIAPIPLAFEGTPFGALAAATFGFCLLATLFFALGPALKLSRTDVLTDLKTQAGEDAVVRRWRFLPRNPLVVAQIALSLGLLVCAGLFIRGSLKAGGADLGFSAMNTLVVEADASLGGYDETRGLALDRAIEDRISGLPGVTHASVAATVPFGFVTIERPVQRAGLHPAKDAKPATAAEGLAYDAHWNSVGADYFGTLGLRLLRGRGFNAAETRAKGAPLVAVIDEKLARQLWPEGDALGQRLQYADRDAARAPGGDGPTVGAQENISARKDEQQTIEIVGIVPSVRTSLFGKEQSGAIYVPFAQGYTGNITLHLRTAADTPESALALVDTLRRELRAAAPALPVFKVRTFRQHMESSAEFWLTRIGAAMFSIFGGLALVLAIIGLYGVKAYSVARRTREIGIRLALGAEPAAVRRLILREGLAMTLAGAGLGLLLALGLGRLCASMLYQVSPVDPLTFALAPVVLIATAMLACYVPARRATKVSPIVALRSE